MTRIVVALYLVGMLSGCGDGSGPAADASADLDIATDTPADLGTATENDVGPGADVCSSGLDADPTCDQLASTLYAVHYASLACTAHADCHVSNDPMCGDDGGGWPYVRSSAADEAKESCLWQAYWAAGCEGAACDWWAPIPRAACLEGTCTQLGTGCTTDADCGEGQVCLTDADSRWPIKTYCDLVP